MTLSMDEMVWSDPRQFRILDTQLKIISGFRSYEMVRSDSGLNSKISTDFRLLVQTLAYVHVCAVALDFAKLRQLLVFP